MVSSAISPAWDHVLAARTAGTCAGLHDRLVLGASYQVLAAQSPHAAVDQLTREDPVLDRQARRQAVDVVEQLQLAVHRRRCVPAALLLAEPVNLANSTRSQRPAEQPAPSDVRLDLLPGGEARHMLAPEIKLCHRATAALGEGLAAGPCEAAQIDQREQVRQIGVVALAVLLGE